MSELNSQLTCSRGGFIAQSVQHRTGIAEVMGSNPVGAKYFFLGTKISAPCLEERRDAVTLLVKQRGQNLNFKRDR